MADLGLRGINYDTGTRYIAEGSSRELFTLEDVERDMRAIAGELNCNSVAVYGTELDRIVAAAGIALAQGLHVSLQLRTVDNDRRGFLDAVAASAAAAAGLGSERVTVNIGCEASLFTRGFLPGRTFMQRMRAFVWFWPFLPIVNMRLNRMLAEAARVARARFGGPITYSAGSWEKVDWTPFDLVGVNLYRDAENRETYTEDLRRLVATGKPVVITEFGCCTFKGAEERGGAGWLAVDYSREPPELQPGLVRSEETQARHIVEMLDLYAAEGVHGAYVYEFLASGNAYASEQRFDLDTASYGIVRPEREEGRTSIAWRPKQAFVAIAARYARPESRSA